MRPVSSANVLLAILVNFKIGFISTCQHKLIGSGVCCENEIVDLHNQFRELVKNGKVPGQPPAAYIKTIEWDNSLAEKARTVAKVCLFKPNRVNDSRFLTGQNLHLFCKNNQNIPTNWTKAITSWFSENEKYKYSETSEKDVHITGHYTQLIWADTYLIGCGYSFFEISVGDAPGDKTEVLVSKGIKYCKLYICNYGPQGNLYGENPYPSKNVSRSVK